MAPVEQLKMIKSRNPQGTREEMEREHIPLDEWGCCCKPEKEPDDLETEILGCQVWRKCDREYKGTGGPRAQGVLLVNPTPTGTRIIQRPMMCYNIPGEREKAETKGGYLKVICDEGEEIIWQSSKPVDTDIPGQGKARIWEDGANAFLIKPTLRPKENPVHRASALAHAVIKEAMAAEEAAKPGQLLGFKEAGSGATTPEASEESLASPTSPQPPPPVVSRKAKGGK